MARNKKKALKIQNRRNVPDPLAPWEIKMSEDYVRRMGKLIEYEWFYIKSGNTYNEYHDKRLKFDELRKYARGEHDTGLAKKLITDGTDGESYSNYDWRPIQVLPKYIKLVINQMLERLYDIDAQAVDGISQGLREDYKFILEKNMIARDMLEDAKRDLNIDMFPPGIGEIPGSQEELDLYMKLNYKPAIELAIEQALKYTLETNEYDEIQKGLLKDLTEIGVAAVHHRTDPTKGIVVEQCDPADMVWSYPTKPNFDNVYYYGYVKRITLSELQRLSGKRFSDDELDNFKNVSNEWQGYNRISNQFWYRGEDLPSYMVDVLDFTFKTTKSIKYKKKYRKNGTFSITEKPSDYTKTEAQIAKEQEQGYPDFDILEDTKEVWIEGSLVLGSDMLFNYRECSDMIRPDGFISNKVSSNYIVYAPELYQGRIQSLVDRVKQDIDTLQQTKIKIDQFIAKAKPNGVWIDIDGLEEVDLGDGNTLSPLELIRFYDETGNLIGSSRMIDGRMNFQGSMPIKELNNGQIAGLEQLMNAYNFKMNLFRDAIGVGQGADGTLPHPDTSVAALQEQTIRANVATRYVLDAQLKITQYLANGLSLRLKSIFGWSNLRDAYINSIGQMNVDILESLKSLHLHDFGITIKLKPDAQDKALLEANMQRALDKGLIEVPDIIDIRRISNLTYASEMLKIKIKKRAELNHQREVEKIRENGNASKQAAEAQALSKQQEYQFKADSEIRILEKQKENKLAEILAEEEAQARLMDLKYRYETGKEVQVEKAKKDNVEYLEDRKDKRTEKQATQQSKMKAQQNKKSTKPIDFEAESDIPGTLDINQFRT